MSTLTKKATISRVHKHFNGETVIQETLSFAEVPGDGAHVGLEVVLTDPEKFDTFTEGQEVEIQIYALAE